MTLLRSSGDV